MILVAFFVLPDPIGVCLEKHINVVQFLNYHKFGSISRILSK